MTSPSQPKRAPELRLPYPLLDYLHTLPGDWVKVILRLLQRAQWIPGVTPSGLALDAGEILISFRSGVLWDAVAPRGVSEDGCASLLRRVLDRLTRDGFVATRKAGDADTTKDTPRSTRRDTPATIVRFLKFRDNLWPGNADATRPAAHGTAHRSDTILAVDPANPDLASRGSPSRREPAAVPSAESQAPESSPTWRDLVEVLRRTVRPEIYERWFAPLSATEHGDELLLLAPNRFHQAFVEDNYRSFLEQQLSSGTHSLRRVRVATAMAA